MANTKLTRTPSSAGNRQKYTISFWVKRGSLGNQFLFNTDGGNEETYLRFKSEDNLQWFEQNSSAVTQANRSTNALFRDTNAWYHIVITRDSTLSTANDRLKFYINGTLITSWAEDATPAQNTNTRWNNNVEHMIGVGGSGSSNYFDGLMSHIHFCDGYAYAASDFGSTDATTGEWKINTNPSVSYGTNGFFILKNDNGVTDQSPNSNNFTVSGTLVDYVDNPSNIFCTLNNRMEIPGSTVYNASSEDSNTNGSHKTIYGSIPFTSGKYYWEAKAKSGSAVKHTIGLSETRNVSDYKQPNNTNMIVGSNSTSYGRGDAIGWYYTTLYKNGSTVASSIHQIANNDIIMVACDADIGKIYFGVNGTWRVANSTTFDAAQHDTTFTTGRFYLPAFSNENCGWFTNFGTGFFGATAISSAGTNASGIGTFEYNVPTGFTALSTKGLNE